LSLASAAGDREQEASVYICLGNLYARQSNHTPALEYYMKALEIEERRNNRRNRILILTNIGAIHHSSANLNRAIYFYEQARTLAEEPDGDVRELIEVDYALTSVYFDQKAFERALAYGEKVVRLSREACNPAGEATGLQALARIYAEGFKDCDRALAYAETLMTLSASSVRNILSMPIFLPCTTARRSNRRSTYPLPSLEGMTPSAMRKVTLRI
jgi:tetratricopeptide (TPR) repeat protein